MAQRVRFDDGCVTPFEGILIPGLHNFTTPDNPVPRTVFFTEEYDGFSLRIDFHIESSAFVTLLED